MSAQNGDGRPEMPRAGVRVVDLTRLLPGPFCTMLLGDFGADVVKVEEPGSGDPVRHTPPFVGAKSSAFLSLNRNKRSLAVDLKHPQGREVLERLAVKADVVVESFRPGVLERLGVTYERLRELNPGLVWCSVSGYGQDGPYRDHAGHDLNYVATAGILGLTVDREGRPVMPGMQLADFSGALNSALGILLALRQRERGGKGQRVDACMLDSAVSLLSLHAAQHLTGEPLEPGRMTLSGGVASYGVYQASCGRWLALGALEPKFWQRFCNAAGKPEWIERQFSQGEARLDLEADLRALFQSRTAEEWLTDMEGKDCCLSAVNDLDEVFADPQVQARHLKVRVPTGDADAPEADALGPGVRLEDTPGRFTRPGPALGEHTDEVLADYGFGPFEVVALRREGVVS